MKKQIFDKEKAVKEKAEREIVAEQEKDKAMYLESLAENPLFKKYVIEDILKKNIDKLSDMRMFTAETLVSAKENELRLVILSSTKARKVLEKILSQFI